MLVSNLRPQENDQIIETFFQCFMNCNSWNSSLYMTPQPNSALYIYTYNNCVFNPQLTQLKFYFFLIKIKNSQEISYGNHYGIY